MRQSGRQQSRLERRSMVVEFVCVVVVILAAVALAVWIVTHVGGGVLNQG